MKMKMKMNRMRLERELEVREVVVPRANIDSPQDWLGLLRFARF